MRVFAFHCGGDRSDLSTPTTPWMKMSARRFLLPYLFYLVDRPAGRVLFGHRLIRRSRPTPSIAWAMLPGRFRLRCTPMATW